ncbi:hypothetical protein AVEN_91785-1 [Araneus ventricosus]|uniref:Uncharacterized protein n=1 Tax=Araneus ventricosus TaxID=182803 RepID=A0A4Y2IUA6_ARAVE|nr:hypothetical protein AVEN_91785-1 [Araneus ventricosus]
MICLRNAKCIIKKMRNMMICRGRYPDATMVLANGLSASRSSQRSGQLNPKALFVPCAKPFSQPVRPWWLQWQGLDPGLEGRAGSKSRFH